MHGMGMRRRYKLASLRLWVSLLRAMVGCLQVLLSPMGLAIVAIIAVISLTAHFLYSHVYGPAFRVWKRYGVKGPEPSPFWGNLKLVEKLKWLKFYQKMYKIYGPVFGLYLGPQAMIMVADPDMLKEIMVKHFDSFTDRLIYVQAIAIGLPPFLIMATGESWRKGRQAISPSFSALKMKAMVPLVQRSCETLQEKLGEIVDSKKSVDVFRMFGDFTMETILAAAFGCEAQIQRGEVDELTNAAKQIFGSLSDSKISIPKLTFMLAHFPILEHVFIWMFKRSKMMDSYKTLADIAVGFVQSRRKTAAIAKYKDLLQLMLDASVEDKDGQRKLSDLEIVSYSITFLLAGYETTANTLAYTAYLLALNPEVQEKLCAEIDEFFQKDTDTESSMYEATQELQYLDMVLQESLRMYPPGARTARHCLKTTDICGVTIPKGARVQIPIHLLHHIPEYWPDPDKFDPKRFTPEEKAKRPQLSHMPFGWGPRNCVAMRFALMELKMALIYILRKYKFKQAPDTEVPLEVDLGITMAPKNGVYLHFVQR